DRRDAGHTSKVLVPKFAARAASVSLVADELLEWGEGEVRSPDENPELVHDLDVHHVMRQSGADEPHAEDALGWGVAALAEPRQSVQARLPPSSAGVSARHVGQCIESGEWILVPEDPVTRGDEGLEVEQAHQVAPGAIRCRERDAIQLGDLV